MFSKVQCLLSKLGASVFVLPKDSLFYSFKYSAFYLEVDEITENVIQVSHHNTECHIIGKLFKHSRWYWVMVQIPRLSPCLQTQVIL